MFDYAMQLITVLPCGILRCNKLKFGMFQWRLPTKNWV